METGGREVETLQGNIYDLKIKYKFYSNTVKHT